MKVGDKIRLTTYCMGHADGYKDFIVEEFRYCLGVFASEIAKEMGHFTPLCNLYADGPDSVQAYMPNVGEYRTNQVPAWMDLPKD